MGAEEARALVVLRRPDLAPNRVGSLGAGFDNAAFLVDGAWVVRFPRRAAAVGRLTTETRVLPLLAPRLSLPVPVPVPVHAAEPAGGYPWPFALHPWLPGRTADRAGLEEALRGRLAAPLGRFLAALHAVGADEARALGAAEDPLGRFDVPSQAASAREGLAWMVRLGLPDARAALEPALAGAEGLRPARASALVHGDLHARHVLVDGRGVLSGVIDWGNVHLGEPATDLAAAHAVLPPAARPAFLAAYGPVDDATWALARFRAAYHSIVVVLYAQDAGDGPLLAEGLGALERIAAGR